MEKDDEMPDKTQKIKDRLHKLLKRIALDEEKTLQQVTEEILENGIKKRGKDHNRRITDHND
jgi:hypothetical protein